MAEKPDAAPHATGVPAFRPLLPTAQQLLPYLQRIDAARLYSNHGPLAELLEARLRLTLQLDPAYLLTASSGTSALVGGILATAGRAGTTRPLALCPAYTFIGTASALQQCGYQLHLVDIERDSWQLSPQKLLHHPLLDRVGMVMPVAPMGRPVDIAGWIEFQQRTGISVVIDGAASIEALLREPSRYLGAIPVALSFHATKVFATGEGGALLCDSPEILRKAYQTLNFGFMGSRESRTASINGKMSEYHAAVGLASLDQLPQRLAEYAAVAAHYREAFDASAIRRPLHATPDVAGNYVILHCADRAESAAVAAALNAAGIESRLWYGLGLQHQPVLHDIARDALPVTDELAPRLLGLPMAPDLEPQTIRRIAQTIATALKT